MVSEVNNIEKSKTRLIDFPKKTKKKVNRKFNKNYSYGITQNGRILIK